MIGRTIAALKILGHTPVLREELKILMSMGINGGRFSAKIFGGIMSQGEPDFRDFII
jgi:hypothetical protein